MRRRGTRLWIYERQAYTPRWWPALLAVAPAAMILAFVIQPPVWALIPGSAFIGWAASQIQWWWWRRRHPILPPQIITSRRAMWN
jgi:hypothetical protein